MDQMQSSYTPDCWSCIGPELFSRALKHYNHSAQLTLLPMNNIMTVTWEKSDKIIVSPGKCSLLIRGGPGTDFEVSVPCT